MIPTERNHLKSRTLNHAVLLRFTYITDAHKFDTELVGYFIMGLKQGKALDIDGLSAEHLHPTLSVILAKLFNLMMSSTFVL